MRRLFPAVPSSSSSSPSPDAKHPRRLSSLPIVAERHAECHGAPRNAPFASNLGVPRSSARSSVVARSSPVPRCSGDPRSAGCAAHLSTVPRPGSCIRQRNGAFAMLLILLG